MSTIDKWQIKCVTDGIVHWYIPDSDPRPTTCPVDSSHAILSDFTEIVDTIEQTTVKIKEETTPTGGAYRAEAFNLSAAPGETAIKNISFDYPITALNAIVSAKGSCAGDILDVVAAPNTIVGVITSNVTALPQWTENNYVVGNKVYYEGSNYICIVDTTTSQNPTNTAFWLLDPLVINVSQTVVDYASVSYEILLFDGIHMENLGWVTAKSTEGRTLTFKKGTINSYAASQPTYVMMNVKFAHNFPFGCMDMSYDFGGGKIGGSYVPAGTVFRFLYTNNSDPEDPASKTKTIHTQINYLS